MTLNRYQPTNAVAQPIAAHDVATTYQISIGMNATTVTALVQSGYILYAMQAVQSTDKAGRPLVWYQTQSYSTSTIVSWTDQYQAYTSTSPIVTGDVIVVGFSADIEPEQTMEVSAGGIGAVVSGGMASAISILNLTTTQYACGISSFVGGKASPSCTFPLYGNTLQAITPLQQVMLAFSTQSADNGTVIGSTGVTSQALTAEAYLLSAYGQGIMIDMAGAHNNARTVNYDINLGWSWGGYSWAQTVPAGTDGSGTSNIAWWKSQ